jgi:hypothetical protein
MTILTIFLGIIVALLILLVISYYLNMKSVSGIMDLKTTIAPITTDKISKPGSPDYYYSVWVYVNTWNTSVKTLFSYENQSLELGSNTQELKFKYKIGNDISSVIITSTFPIQKWTHVAISKVGSVLDFYLDGKLIKSYQPNGSITNPSPTSSINFGDANKHDIYLAKFQRNPTALDPRTAWRLYLSGPGTGVPMSSNYNYNLSMSVLKDDVVQKTYSIY